MGLYWGKMLSTFGWVPSSHKILMLGLDFVGKTTILHRFKQGLVVETIGTIGYNVEWTSHSGISEGLIFVVGLNDKNRVLEARDKLHAILGDVKNLTKNNVSLSVLANKQGLEGAMSISEVNEKLELSSVRDLKYFLQGCSAITGEGLHEGLEWLTLAIQGP